MQASIYKIIPIDANIGGLIKFSWHGNQVFKNRCIIKSNHTNEIVYDNTVDSFKMEHNIDLSKATLLNGNKYNAFITVFDKENIESDIQSIGEMFICLKTPDFIFADLSDKQVISSSSYTFVLDYQQENSELLDSWSIAVYNKSHSLLATSGVKYNTESLSYIFSGFSNKNEYYVRGTGKTINGILLDTGFINISVTYNIKDIFSLLEPTNMAEIGAIHLRSNIVSAEGILEKEPGTYINNEYLDLRDNLVTYNKGFLFKENFSLVELFYGQLPNQTVMTFGAYDNTQLTGNVTYRIAKFGTQNMLSAFELNVVSNGITAVYYSNKITLLSENDIVGLCVTRSDGLFNIEITKYGEVR